MSGGGIPAIMQSCSACCLGSFVMVRVYISANLYHINECGERESDYNFMV